MKVYIVYMEIASDISHIDKFRNKFSSLLEPFLKHGYHLSIGEKVKKVRKRRG